MALYTLPYSVDITLESESKIARPDEAFALAIDARALLARVGAEGHLDFHSLRIADRHFIISNWEGQGTERLCPVQWVPAPDFHPMRNPRGTLFFRVTRFPWADSDFPRRYRLYFDTVRGGGKRAFAPEADDRTAPLRLSQDEPGSVTLQRTDDLKTALGFQTPAGRKPGFHPVTTPAGHTVTTQYPVDHIWHRGVWFAWTDIEGERTAVRPYSFWGEPRTGTIWDRGITNVYSGALAHGFTQESTWCTENGVPLLDMTIGARWQTIGEAWSFLDLTLTLAPAGDEAVILNTNYGHLNLRSSTSLRQPVAMDSASEGEPLLGDDHNSIPVQWTGFGGTIDDNPVSLIACDAPDNALPGEDRPCWRDLFFEKERPYLRENGTMFLVTSLNPIRGRPLRMEPGMPRQWRYRVVTSDRPLSADFAEYQQKHFAQPLTARFGSEGS